MVATGEPWYLYIYIYRYVHSLGEAASDGGAGHALGLGKPSFQQVEEAGVNLGQHGCVALVYIHVRKCV